MIERICPKCNVIMNSERCINPKCGHVTQMTSTIYWCKNCNVPIYESICPICAEKGDYLATDVRPVFPEENMLLSIIRTGKPFTYQKDSVWASNNVYFINGKKIKLSVTQLNKKPISKIEEIRYVYYSHNQEIYSRIRESRQRL